jgi:hypothetical protein
VKRRKRNHRRARKRVDGRTALGLRVKALVACFSDRLPDADDVMVRTAVQRAAEMVALSEDLRGRMLRGELVSADDVLRLTRTADLMVRRLHLDRKPPASNMLFEYLRDHYPNNDGERERDSEATPP